MNEIEVVTVMVSVLIAAFSAFLLFCPNELSGISFRAAGYVEAVEHYTPKFLRLLFRLMNHCWTTVKEFFELIWDHQKIHAKEAGALLIEMHQWAGTCAERRRREYATKTLAALSSGTPEALPAEYKES